MKDSEIIPHLSWIKEYVEAHEAALNDIHAEIEDLKDRLLKEGNRRINIEDILDTHRVEIKALSGLLKSMLKQVAQVESDLAAPVLYKEEWLEDLTTGEVTP